jgi:hypothetical protein
MEQTGRKNLPKTRLKVGHYDPDEYNPDGSPSRNKNLDTHMSLSMLLERASSNKVHSRYNPASSEEFWLKETVQDMLLSTGTFISPSKSKTAAASTSNFSSLLPPRGPRPITVNELEESAAATASPFASFCRALTQKAPPPPSSAAAQNQQSPAAILAETVSSSVKYLNSLPAVTTPRQMLKQRRRTKQAQQQKPFQPGTTQRNLNEPALLDSAYSVPFSNPRVHSLDVALQHVTFIAQSELSQETLRRPELDVLLSCSRASSFAKSQLFNPTNAPHQLSQAKDRFLSYALPGSTSMVRSDTTLGAGVHCTQRLVQLKDRGVHIVEIILNEGADGGGGGGGGGDALSNRDEEWCVLMAKKSLWTGRTLPALTFKPSLIEGAMEDGHRRKNAAADSNRRMGMPPPPPPPPRKPPMQLAKEVFFLSKTNFSIQAGIPSHLRVTARTSDKGWKKTRR